MIELPLPTDTALVRIDSRQYRLFNADLGEGIPRIALKVGAATVIPWFLLCWLVGVPAPDLLLVWILPPMLTTWAAGSRDAGGRLRYIGWGDWLVWAVRRQAPIVNAGTTSSAAPRPVAAPIAFYVSDLSIVSHDDALQFIPGSVRADFVTPPGRLPTRQERTRAHS